MVNQRAPMVLVIDDEDYVADMIAAALEMEGYAVEVAYNGRDGLLRAGSAEFALLIVDIMMPYLSGPELIAQLHSHKTAPSVPIILISAGARPRAALPGVIFLSKPFNIEHLIEVVSEQLGRVGSEHYES